MFFFVLNFWPFLKYNCVKLSKIIILLCWTQFFSIHTVKNIAILAKNCYFIVLFLDINAKSFYVKVTIKYLYL